MRDLTFDWDANAMSEKYFMFAFAGRMNMSIPKQVNFLGTKRQGRIISILRLTCH